MLLDKNGGRQTTKDRRRKISTLQEKGKPQLRWVDCMKVDFLKSEDAANC